MAELDTFAKLVSAVHEILPNAVFEEDQTGQIVIYPYLKEVEGKIVPIAEEDSEWIDSAEFDAWLKGEKL